jgi:hypothetical protein
MLWGRTIVDTGKAGLRVSDGIAELRHGREAFEEHSAELLGRLYPTLAKAVGVTIDSLSSRHYLETESNTCRFELIDFDVAGFSDAGATVPYEHLRNHHQLYRELVGFLRLTRQGVWSNYPVGYLHKFMSKDIGHRADDLWIIVGRRLFRRHPDNRPDVQRYFADVVLMAAAMVAREATLEAMSDAITMDSRRIAKSAMEVDIAAGKTLDETVLARAASIMPSLMSPSRFADHFQHDFFREVSERIGDALGLRRLEEQVANQLASYFVASGSLLAQVGEMRSLRFDESVERLTRYILVLTIAVVLATVVQVILSAIG